MAEDDERAGGSGGDGMGRRGPRGLEEHTGAGHEGRSESESGRGTSNVNDAPASQTTATNAPEPGDTADSGPSISGASGERESGVRGRKRKSDEISRDPRAGQQQPLQGSANVEASAQTDTTQDSVNGDGSTTLQTQEERSMSPRGRTRGMSLRSSLFSKNMQRRTTTDNTVIELQTVPSAGEGTGDASVPEKDADSSATVVVSPSLDRLAKPPLSSSSSGEAGKMAAVVRNYRDRSGKKARQLLPIQRISDAYATVRKFVLRIHDIPPSKDGRHILIDCSRDTPLTDERTGHPYMDNFIKSSKYTIWNFLPRQLFAQFSKLANFYFLTVSILQMIPGLSTTGRFTTFAPLMFFVSLSMGKEGYEDFRRHRLDKADNNRMVKVFRPQQTDEKRDEKHNLETGRTNTDLHHWTEVKWQSLQVGDIIKLDRNEPSPADILLLDSKGEHSIAYIETMALDGETNLKNKQPPGTLIGKCSTPADVSALRAEVVIEDPNVDLYNFEGKVSLTDSADATPLTNNEVVYRGSVLRNTPEAVGMVIYSGEECKIRMNANKNPRIKAPLLQSIVNKIVIMMVVFVLALSFSQAISYQYWDHFENIAWYLTGAHVSFGPLITSFILMFNTLIPLSLYVALEIIKVGQILLLNDIDMYDEASDTPFEAHTSTINEELGQVSYVFSDKTGTLTENVMRFRKLSVAGTAWLHDLDIKKQSVEDRVQRQLERNELKGKGPLHRLSRKSTSRSARPSKENSRSGSQTPRKSIASWKSSAACNLGQPELNTIEMIRYIQRRPHTAFARKASMMILSMALCHTCIPEHGKTEDDITFQASSPDELALVEAAKELGYVAYHREMSTLTLKTYPNGMLSDPVWSEYEILDVIEFSSQRKRMSVVVRCPDGRICVMCKGADSVIMERLRLADLARRTVADIEQRVSERRNAGAQQALRRQSSVATDRRPSVISNRRPSLGLQQRSRSSIGRLAPVRDNVDGWLAERESESITPVDQSHYSPRPSMQRARHSSAFASRRSSYQQDYREDDLVEEALVLNDTAVIKRCFQHINDFATEGLRTLLYGHRFLDGEEYQAWKKVYSDATTSLDNRQQKIEEAGELIEQNLELGGATAIEDKLQNGVPETIDRLRRANIKMWMLTGDKRETAINIGHSCRLIKDYSALTILDHTSGVGSVEQRIASATTAINAGSIAHSVIIVDGQTLGTIQADASLQTEFLNLAVLADSVICCRASPSQKAGLVSSIRQRITAGVTLAIGDGANDIAMIQEAHVGIGITGKEGLQAARVSDYSIAQFRFLSKLLLVHGRWNYVRTCKYVVGTFWKELLFYLTQALFQRYNGYTGQSLYEEWSLAMFNTLFTSLPVIFLGIFEKDLAASTLIAVPELYTKGQRSAGFNFRVYFSWMFMAVCESVFVFYTMYGLYGEAIFTTGQDLFSMGVLSYSACIIVINTKLQLIEQRYKTTLALACVVIEIGGWFLWNIIFNFTYNANNMLAVESGFVERFGQNVLWWLTLILAVAACILYELGVRAVKCAFWPTDVEVFQALEKDPVARARFEAAAAETLRQGWEVGRGESSELARIEEKRAEEVVEMLEKPGVVEEGNRKAGLEVEEQVLSGAERPADEEKKGIDVHEVFAKGFGKVKK